MDTHQLKKQRKGIKTSLTTFENYLNKFNAQVHPLSELKVRLEKIEPIFEKFNEIQLNLDDISTAEEATDDYREVFETQFFRTVAKARDIIENRSRTNIQHENIAIDSVIKLPSLSFPKFNGDYTQWLVFKDSYNSAIHTNSSLNPIEKFRYLRSLLIGDALQFLNSLETTQENYKVAWELLVNRYENKRIIAHTHMKSLFDLPPITREAHVPLRNLIDAFQMHVRALEQLREPVDHWDTILIYLLSTKLDNRTQRDWEEENGDPFGRNKPSLKDLIIFLAKKCNVLKMTDKVARSERKPHNNFQNNYKKNVSLTTTKYSCPMCNEQHLIFNCHTLINMAEQERINKVKDLRLCINCLRSGYTVSQCNSKHTCRKCKKRHNTLLHLQHQPSQNIEANSTPSSSSSTAVSTSVASYFAQQGNYDVLLATAEIYVYDSTGHMHEARALLDSGSQSSFITKNLADKLNLKLFNINIPVNSLNSCINISKQATINIKSKHNEFYTSLNCLLLQNITSNLPQVQINKVNFNITQHISLADPKFDVARPIDILIGADRFWQILGQGQIKLSRGLPILQNTWLGWIISGPIHESNLKSTKYIQSFHCTSLQSQLEKFWLVEESNQESSISKEDELAEELYAKDVSRGEDDRFIVGLPQRPNIQIGKSLTGALRRFYSTESRLKQNPSLKQQYIAFMRKYQELNHMSEFNPNQNELLSNSYFLPYHAVLKEDSLSTKLRVVFDGSFKTTSGVSINQKLLTGPNLQNDLFSIILRFRVHKYVLSADISMMFRQIDVKPDDRHLQCICWRENQEDPIKYYLLNTVTYGTVSAPYLANRTLRELAVQDGERYPIAKQALQNDFYMDDVLSGAASIEECATLQMELTKLLARGKFHLRKWRSNDRELLSNLEEEAKADELLIINEQEGTKTLGIRWNARLDSIEYSVKINESEPITKRSILSQIATIYDPLGLLGPIIIAAKAMLQTLWEQKLTWDDPVPAHLQTGWKTYTKSLSSIHEIHTPRNVTTDNMESTFDIIGFCDASIKAYGACIYVRSSNQAGNSTCRLLCAKSKVAPIKTISLPRLELCSALILSRLLSVVKRSLDGRIRNIYLWSD